MKKYLLVGLVIAVAAIGTANAQNFTAPAAPRTDDTTRVERPVTPRPPRSVGAFPRTARNPAQLVNPAAPRRYYGPPEETVSGEDPARSRSAAAESNHFRSTGVILFGLRF